jgi:hypothetical protein
MKLLVCEAAKVLTRTVQRREVEEEEEDLQF